MRVVMLLLLFFTLMLRKKRSREGPGILFFLLESHELFEMDIYVRLLS